MPRRRSAGQKPGYDDARYSASSTGLPAVRYPANAPHSAYWWHCLPSTPSKNGSRARACPGSIFCNGARPSRGLCERSTRRLITGRDGKTGHVGVAVDGVSLHRVKALRPGNRRHAARPRAAGCAGRTQRPRGRDTGSRADARAGSPAGGNAAARATAAPSARPARRGAIAVHVDLMPGRPGSVQRRGRSRHGSRRAAGARAVRAGRTAARRAPRWHRCRRGR